MNKKIQEVINNELIAQIKKGVNPWAKPWKWINKFRPDFFAYNFKTKKPYQGLNQCLLAPGCYLTFLQIKELKWHLKKGSKSSSVIYYAETREKASIDEREKLEDLHPEGLTRHTLYAMDGYSYYIDKNNDLIKYKRSQKIFNVFNIIDCDEFEESMLEPEKVEPLNDGERYENAEKVIKAYLEKSGVKLFECDTDEAYYAPYGNFVNMPKLEQFANKNEYYSTLFHELSHSTNSILHRFDPKDMEFGNPKYATEEITVEITKDRIMSALELTEPGEFSNSASYVKSWGHALFKTSDDEELEKLIELLIVVTPKSNEIYDLIMGEN